MERIKDYFGDYYLSKEENIKLDFIHAEESLIPGEDYVETNGWTLTINVGQTNEKGYVDALIIEISDAQYPTFLDQYSEKPEARVEFKIKQLPEGWDRKRAFDLVSKYAKEIEQAISDFEIEEY